MPMLLASCSKSCSMPKSLNLFLTFSSIRFRVSGFIFEHLDSFVAEVFFFFKVEVMDLISFFCINYQVAHHHLVKMLSFFPNLCFWLFCKMSGVYMCVELCLCPLFYSIDQCFPFYANTILFLLRQFCNMT